MCIFGHESATTLLRLSRSPRIGIAHGCLHLASFGIEVSYFNINYEVHQPSLFYKSNMQLEDYGSYHGVVHQQEWAREYERLQSTMGRCCSGHHSSMGHTILARSEGIDGVQVPARFLWICSFERIFQSLRIRFCRGWDDYEAVKYIMGSLRGWSRWMICSTSNAKEPISMARNLWCPWKLIHHGGENVVNYIVVYDW